MKLAADDLASRRPAPQWRFLQLALVMFSWMIVYPRLERVWLAQVVLQIVMLDVMLVTLWANPSWIRLRRIVVGLLLLSVVASVIANLDLPQAWVRVNATTQGVLHLPIMAACVAGVLTFVFRSERPTLDGIFATVVAYLLVAMMFAQVYGVALVWNPEALHLGSSLDQLTPQGRDGRLLYFSVVTLATLGYGDFLPTSDVTRMLAAVEAIVGQFYVAVIVAVFVGMYATQGLQELQEKSSRRTEARRDD